MLRWILTLGVILLTSADEDKSIHFIGCIQTYSSTCSIPFLILVLKSYLIQTQVVSFNFRYPRAMIDTLLMQKSVETQNLKDQAVQKLDT